MTPLISWPCKQNLVGRRICRDGRVTFTVEALAGKPLEALPLHSAITGGVSANIVAEANFPASLGVRFPGVFGIDCEGRLPFFGRACNTVAVKSCPTHGSSTSASVSLKARFIDLRSQAPTGLHRLQKLPKDAHAPTREPPYRLPVPSTPPSQNGSPNAATRQSRERKSTNTSMDNRFLLVPAETKGLVSRATEQALGVAH